jgi:hypothetical protein
MAYIKVHIVVYLKFGLKYEYLNDTKVIFFPISNFMSWFYKDFFLIPKR